MRKDVIELCARAAEAERDVLLTTNGWFPALLRKLLDSPAVRRKIYIQLSLDGTREVHDAIRAEGSFDRVMECVEICREAGIAYQTSTTIQAGNLNDVPGLLRFLAERDIPNHVSMHCDVTDGWLAPDWSGSLEAEAVAREVLDQYYLDRFYQGRRVPGSGCRAGITHVVLVPNGNVEACCYSAFGEFGAFTLGNLVDFDFDFDALWGSAQADATRDKVQDCPGCGMFCDR